MGAPWEAPDSSETKFARNRSLSAMAGSGAASCEAKVAGVSRRHGSADGLRSIIPCDSRTRQGIIFETCAENRSEERRVGKECRSRWTTNNEKTKIQYTNIEDKMYVDR